MKTRIALFALFSIALMTLRLDAQPFGRGARAVTGTVSSVEGTTIRLFDDRLTLDASRAIVRSDSGPARVSDIHPGDRISAFVFPWGDGLVAETIHILRVPDAALSGPVESVDSSSGVLTLMGLQVRVTAATVLRGLGGHAITLSDILPNQQVIVELDRLQPGLVASTIIVASPVPDFPTTFIGVVESITSESWTVRGSDATVVVKVTPDTHIIGTPRVGDQVMVAYRTDSSGQNIALSISLAPKPPEQLPRPMRGTVVEITATSLTITFLPTDDFATFVITPQTEFFGGRPSVDDRVLVHFRPEGDRNIALRVVRVDSTSEPRITFDGTLHVIRGNRWIIDTHEVVVTDRTRIVGDPKPGDRVHVIATQRYPDVTLYGVEIAKLNN